MSLYDLWANGTLIGIRPFPYFAPLLSLAVFILIVFVITGLKQVTDNQDQHVLW